MKILIVEDDDEILRLMHLILCSMLNHEVHGVKDVKSARDVLDSFKPDLVLLDLVMDGEDPIHFVQYLKSSHPFIKVILVSASSKLEDIANELQVGYLPKPFSIENLDKIILTSKGVEIIA